MEFLSDETRTLRRTMRDLVALSALPAVWVGYRPLQVAEGLADVLRSTLRLDLVYLCLPGQTVGEEIEVARTAAGPLPADQARDIGRALAPWLDGAATDPAPSLPNPAGAGMVRVVAVPVGCGRPNGVLVAGSQRTGFPTEEDRLLLSVAANQAAAVLQRERDEDALRESEERYRSVITAMQEGVVLLGADGRIRACNAGAERILGLSAEQIMGRTTLDPHWQAIHEDGSPFPGETHPVMVTLRTGRPCSNVVMGVRKPGGELTWVSINSQPLRRDGEPTPYAVVASFADITERKKAEEALRESEHRWRSLTEALPQLVWTATPDGLLDYGGVQTAKYMGRPVSELLGWGWLEALHPDDRERTVRAWQTAVAGQSEYEIEHRFRRFDGAYRWFKTRGVAMRDGAGNTVKWLGTCTDITTDKQLEEELRRANERLELAVHGSNVGVWDLELTDGDYRNARRHYVNFWEQLGYESPPTGRENALDEAHPDDRARVEEAARRYLAGETTEFETKMRVRHKDGSYRTMLARGAAVRDAAGKPVRFVGISLDVTRLKRAEAELSRERYLLNSLMDNIPDKIYFKDAASRFLRINKALATYVGLSDPAQAIGKMDFDFFTEEHARLAREDEQQIMRTGEPLVGKEEKETWLDGRVRWVSSTKMPLRDKDGAIVGTFGVSRDISNLKLAEEALRASEQRFRTFVDHATDAFFLQDDHGVILDVNRQACASLGRTREELVGTTPADFDHDVTPALLEELDRRLNAGETVAFESRHRRKDGAVFPVEIRGRAFWEGGQRFLVSLSRDVSERKQDEALLIGQKQILEQIIQGEPLPHVLAALCRTLEELSGGEMLAAILLLDADGVHLRHGAAPSLPESYTRAIDGLPIGPEVRSCGTAAYRREPVYVADIAGDPRWASHAEVALAHGLRACWSSPILSSRGEVLGTFGMYYRQPRHPSPRDLRAVDIVTRTVAIAIEKSRAETALRESEERWRSLTEALPQLVWSAAPDGACDYFSRQWTQHTGVPESDLLGWRWLEVLHPEDREPTRKLWTDSVAGRGPYDVEYRVRRSDGVYRWFKTRGVPIRGSEGAIFKWFGTCTDMTDAKQAEAEQRLAREAAEAANRAKDEFLANVSHEIRTPMNAILNMTELALDTPLTEDQRQCLKTVKSAADNLLGLINDLLDFSKIEAGKLELDPADFGLRAALGDTLRALAVRAHRKGLELLCHVQPDVPDALVGDAGRLRQILLNLVGNAIKFTDEGEVVVTVGQAASLSPDLDKLAACRTDVALRFTVRDTGIGIPPDKQERIFRAFEQEDTSTTRKYGGTGLGLTIASRLATLMGGQITVDSEPGRGSTFTVTARFGLQPHPPEPSAIRPPVLLHGLPVLVVDDNATNRRILEEWLRDWQMEPAAVGDSLAALDALWHGTACGRPYALVLLDARMPDADGLALAAHIRQRAELSATRIILLTSGDRPGDLARFREQRFNAHLLKPVQQDELLETIYRVMSRANGDAPPTARPAWGRAPAPAPVPAATPLHILVAEDNEFNAQVLEQLLTRRGHQVRLAVNGREALSLAGDGAFDLLLLDIHMPELDGFQVARAVRERERITGGHLPVIALTARSRKEDREQCLAAGMDDFLTKPIQVANLWAAIDRLVPAPPPAVGRIANPSYAEGTGAGPLDPRVLLASCGGDAGILETLCRAFRARLPDHMTEVRNALRDRDAPRLREAAHKLCGMGGAFSTAAGDAASELEDCAAQGLLEEAAPLVERLETMAQELMRLAGGLSLETLQRHAHAPSSVPT